MSTPSAVLYAFIVEASFPIIDVFDWFQTEDALTGLASKFWIIDPAENRWLFKERKRPEAGEDWSEKIASEIASLCGITCAAYELAVCRETSREGNERTRLGVITRDLVRHRPTDRVIPGNEVLVGADGSYPARQQGRIPEYTVARVLKALSQDFILPPEVEKAPIPGMTPPEWFFWAT